MTSRAAKFAAVAAVLYAAHQIGDHPVQNGGDSQHKQEPGLDGRRACRRHVATYTITTGLAVGVANAALGLNLTWPGIVAGQAISAFTHYPVDRGAPLRRMAARIGKLDFIEGITVVRQPGFPADDRGPGTGSYALDQAWHIGWLAVAALVTAAI